MRGEIMNLYISDLHFGHRNVIEFDKRPFADVDEMDHMLIELWNARVCDDDHVYIVGDFSYRTGRAEQWYLKQLKGHKHLVVGNHDHKLISNEKAMSYIESVDKIMFVKDQDKNIILCHYPLTCWNKEKYGAWHIYGHIHGNWREDRNDPAEYMKNKERALNAGCMINNYAPASFKELVENNARFWKEREDAIITQ